MSRVGDVDTKDMDYDALIRLFQTNVRPLTVEFKYMEPKRPPPLESVKTNGTLSPPISPDVERNLSFHLVVRSSSCCELRGINLHRSLISSHTHRYSTSKSTTSTTKCQETSQYTRRSSC